VVDLRERLRAVWGELDASEMFGLLKQPWLIQPGPVETLVDSTINQESTRK